MWEDRSAIANRVHAAIVLAIAAVVLSRDAHAHAGERAFVLLLPTGYYLVGGTLAVAASVALLALLPAGKLNRLAAWRWRILEFPLVSVTVTSCASFAFLMFLVVCGLAGSRDPLANPLPLTVWTLLWIGLTLLQGLFGNLWHWINPWYAPVRLLGLSFCRGFLSENRDTIFRNLLSARGNSQMQSPMAVLAHLPAGS